VLLKQLAEQFWQMELSGYPSYRNVELPRTGGPSDAPYDPCVECDYASNGLRGRYRHIRQSFLKTRNIKPRVVQEQGILVTGIGYREDEFGPLPWLQRS
jgi:hypothetical protein